VSVHPIRADDLRPHAADAWPLPAHGETATRWSALVALGERDLPLAKLVEPHHDAAAILADLGLPSPVPGDLWAVWASEPPFAVLTAHDSGSGWTLSGRKAFCSGAELVTHALVTARTPDGSRLFAVELADPGVSRDGASRSWAGPGMARAATLTLSFDAVTGTPVGSAGDYTSRPGFWWGAVGIAAIWLGGARGVTRPLEGSVARLDAHGLAHLGAVRAELESAQLMLDAVARRADHDDLDEHDAERLALVVRDRISTVVDVVVERVGRALGPGPLAFDADHASRVADLQVFVRQHHAERDQERLGAWEPARA
jgi:alkylation response protein AidB-like acyl-CoA dehydrogenase